MTEMKKRILEASKEAPVLFNHSKWGEVYAKKMTVRDMAMCNEQQGNSYEFLATFTSYSLCDEKGNKVFSVADCMNLLPVDINEFVDFAMKVNGMDEPEKEENAEEKNV